ncbi:MAG: glycosyltransferase family 2 protein [Desulfobacteraceae bacterium]|nr:MAG: glycosyltransferase family 2 protein [Desulfobacteraceae bacterium]
MTQLTISIVSHNSKADLELLMPSLIKSLNNINHEILHVDNSSSDGTWDFMQQNYPGVLSYQNSRCFGYGTNHNHNLRRANGKYIVFMNSDMIIMPDTFEKLFVFMEENEDVGLCSANVLNTDGTMQYLYKRYPTILDLSLRRFAPGFITRMFRKRLDQYEMRDDAYHSVVDVPFISGCFMFCRTDLIRQVSGFDERFFLYFEDVDLCRKVQNHARTVSFPEAVVVHRWERMAHKKARWFYIFVLSAFKYFNKWGYQFY